VRILWVKTELLHPVDKGGRIRTYQMLRALAREHEVTYLCLDDGGAAADAAQRAAEYCTELITVPFHPAKKFGARFFLELAGNVLSSLPYAIARYRSDVMRAQIERLAPGADLVVCDFLAPSQNVPSNLGVTTVLFQHNVEATIWQRHASVAKDPVRRAYLRAQWRRMRQFEAKECRRFDRVVAVSDADSAVIRSEYGVVDVGSVPTGVDLDYFSPPTALLRQGSEILFVGSMDWMPNEEGIRWFVEHVFEAVRARHSNATLTIVGRAPSDKLRRLADRTKGVSVTGAVPDVRPYLARAGISVVPLRVGGGTRIKIYEAMAMGVPVVSTTIGAEGLPIKHAQHLLIADTAAEQVESIARLMSNPLEAQNLSASALAFVRQHGSWSAVANAFLTQCLSQAPLRRAVAGEFDQ
jgi:sugar transferase (PEP-CTERM/EpsH1 system associated)